MLTDLSQIIHLMLLNISGLEQETGRNAFCLTDYVSDKQIQTVSCCRQCSLTAFNFLYVVIVFHSLLQYECQHCYYSALMLTAGFRCLQLSFVLCRICQIHKNETFLFCAPFSFFFFLIKLLQIGQMGQSRVNWVSKPEQQLTSVRSTTTYWMQILGIKMDLSSHLTSTQMDITAT